MAREMIVHFEPHGGGNSVEAEVFVASLGAIVEGFKSISNALAPAIAQHHNWSRALVRDALTLGFSALTEGSLVVCVTAGAAPTGALLDNRRIAELGWSAAAMAINGAAHGKLILTDVPLVAAQNFARAARVARDSNVGVSLRSRRVKAEVRSPWRTNVDLTSIEPALSKYIERRSASESTTTQIVGKLTSLDYDPPGFVLETGRGKIKIGMRTTLREKAWDNWGHEVVVVAEAKIAADGRISDPKAIDILRAETTASEDDEEAGFGLLKGVLATEHGREYFETLRGRN